MNVILEGTTTGTTTDAEGQYSLDVPDLGRTLVFSYVGYEAQEVPIDGRTVIDVALSPDVAEMEEVVVTALGIERQERELSYATAQVEAAELVKVNTPTVATALYGKIPGMNISQNASGPTGGINLTIRGVRSITGNNRPLIVVDGIPIRDEDSGYSTVGWEYNRDLGSGLNDINPQDIASISVLKGAAAAALYGSEAANGVVLITTKSGAGLREGALGVEFSSAVDFTTTVETLNFQNEYGAGTGYLSLGPNNNGTFNLDEEGVPLVPVSSYSWGPRMEGQEVLWWDGVMRPFSPQPDNYYSMFDTGLNATNSIALSSVTEGARYRLSYTRRDYEGIVVGTQNASNNFSLSTDLQVAPQLTAEVSINYYNRVNHNPPPKIYVAYNFPRSLKMDLLKQYYKTEEGYNIGYAQSQGRFENLVGSTVQLMDQVFWRQLENSYGYQKDHLISSLTVGYDVTSGLNLRVRAGTDFTTSEIEEKNSSTQPAEVGPSGSYAFTKDQSRIVYGEALLTARQQLTDDFGIEALAGVSSRRTYLDHSYVGTNGGLVVENWFSTNNTRNDPWEDSWRASEATDGVFGSLKFSFRDYLFLEVTGRNDWTSTLPPDNNSYFYPSVGASFIFSEAFTLPAAISFGKLRVNYAEVGRGAPRYDANRVYGYGNWEGVTTNSFSTVVPPLDLQPERQKSIELGLNMAFFDHRLGFDLTYYDQRNVDQIINLAVAHSSGATALTVNNGLMLNSGLEAQLRVTPVMTEAFQWDAMFNFAKNWNKVERLAAGLERLVHTGIDDNIFIESRPGGEFGAIYGYGYEYAPSGERIVDASGIYAKSDELSHIGNILPDWTGGLLNTLRYKNLALSAALDVHVGGDLISMTNYWGYATGKWEETLQGRSAEYGGLPYYIDGEGDYVQLPDHDAAAPEGRTVYHDGIILDGVQAVFNDEGAVVGYEPNDQLVPSFLYYLYNYNWKNQGIYPEAVYDNSYVKLRELALSYQLPESWIQRMPLQRLSVSLLGRNLAYLFKNVPNIDPESAISSDPRLQGYEYMTWPSTRSFGFRIDAVF